MVQSDKQRDAQFTLMKALVDVLILGILAVWITLSVMDRPAEARVAAVKSDILAIHTAILEFRIDTGRYPSTEQGLRALQQGWSGSDQEARLYTRSSPTDPWGKEYHYKYDGSSYEIYTYGADGKPGGEGDDADVFFSELD